MNLMEALLSAKLGGSGGGSADVTAASVLAAMQAMNNTQASAALVALGGAPMSQALTDAVKNALLTGFANLVWKENPDGAYYLNLQAALYPIVSISAVYNQSGPVYATDSLDSLKQDLTVTANFENGSTADVTDYTLSGTLAVGISTVTVSYAGKSTTFSVTVSEQPYIVDLANSDFHIQSNTLSYPYYFTGQTNRYSYSEFDLAASGGKRYRVNAVVNYATAQVGCQFYNEAALEAVASQGSFSQSDLYDTTWIALESEFDVPANVNGSPIAGVRFSLRKDTINSAIPSDFTVSRLTLEEVS